MTVLGAPTGLTLAQLEALIAVLEAGSFTRASVALGLSQSAVSRAVAALESHVGVQLVDRGRTGVRATFDGNRIASHARAALSEVASMRERPSEAAGLEVGRLRLATLASTAVELVPRLIASFRTAHPTIELALLEGSDEEVREWILTRAVDVGVITLPANGLHAQRLAEDEMVAVLPTRHVLAGQRAVSASRLSRERFILSTGGCEPLIRAFFHASGRQPNVSYRSRDMAAILAMVGEGLGVSIVPTLSLSRGARGVITVPLEPRLRRRLALATRRAAVGGVAVGAFLSHAAR